MEVDGKKVKAYRGMASTAAGSDYPEGVSGYVEYKGSVEAIVERTGTRHQVNLQLCGSEERP